MYAHQLTLNCLGYLKDWALLNLPLLSQAQWGSGHSPEFPHGWLACFLVVPVSHPSIHSDLVISLFSLHPSLSNSKGPTLSPFVHPLAAGIIIDGLKTNWGQGPLVLGHADSWLNHSIRTSLQQYTAYYISVCVHCEIFLQSSEGTYLSPPRATTFLVCGYNTSKFHLYNINSHGYCAVPSDLFLLLRICILCLTFPSTHYWPCRAPPLPSSYPQQGPSCFLLWRLYRENLHKKITLY